MKLSRLLRKPGWESRQDDMRAQAVGQQQDPELLAQLDQIARLDPAPTVRAAALRRLDDLALLADRMQHDADTEVRGLARSRLGTLMCAATASDTIQAALRVLRVLEDATFDQEIARAAQATELRRTALARIDKPGFLLDRCQSDPDAEIRAMLLDRLDGPATLERLAEATRKTDKTLSRLARMRAQALRLAAGEPDAIKQRVLDIADVLDLLRRERPDDVRTRAAALIDEWQIWRERVDVALVRRVDGYVDILRASLDYVRVTPSIEAEPPGQATAEPSHDTPSPDTPVVQDVLPTPPPPDLEAQRRAEEQYARREAERAAKQAALARAHDEHEALQAILTELEQALASKQLGAARAAHGRIVALRQAQCEASHPRALARLRQAEQELDGLARWQHWSNNKVRARLCDDLHAIASAGLHPDALALKVKQSQTQWQQLAQSEQAPGVAATTESGLDKRFRALCHRLLAPARPYFEKRDELRDQRKQQLDALLQRADAVLTQGQGPARIALRRELVTWLRRLDDIDPRERTSAGKRLREYLARCDQARAAQDEQIHQSKHKLIANLRRKLAQAELDEALELCKAAQAQWRDLPRAARDTEQSLQHEFDALVEPWFDQARQRSTSLAAAEAERAAGVQAVLDQLANLAQSDDETLKHATTQLAQLNVRWRELRQAERSEPPANTSHTARRGERRERGDARGRDDTRRPRAARTPDALERRFDDAVQRVQLALSQREQRRERDALRALAQGAQCCVALESLPAAVRAEEIDDWRARWQGLGIPNAAQALYARFERALHGSLDDAEREHATTQADELVVLAEMLAGIDSPASARETRRALQVARLQARLSGATSADASGELRDVFQRWCATGPLRADSAVALTERMHRAAHALLG
jgi:hypothetical protein